MMLLELNRKQSFNESDFPLLMGQLKVAIHFDFATEVPQPAARRMALRWLREVAAEAEDEDFLSLNPSADVEREATPASQHGTWVQPAGMDLRVLKSAHRLILEVSKRGESGKAVLASDLGKDSGLSAPTLGRLLREGEPANDYLRQFVAVSPSGRTKGLDLTPAGRLLASRIRAGTIPA
jgi:hypothetical protein